MDTLDRHAGVSLELRAAEILVVDTDPATAAAVRAAVPAGTRVTVAPDGYQALHAMTDHVPDLVVLEVLLPGIGGRALVERIHACAGAVPIVVATHSHEALPAGGTAAVTAVLHKPVDSVRLLDAIAAALGR